MAVVFSNITRLSRTKTTNYAQILRHYSNVKHTKSISNNSLKLLGVLSGGLAALSYLKWQNTYVVQAFNPKKMKVGAEFVKNSKNKLVISATPSN